MQHQQSFRKVAIEYAFCDLKYAFRVAKIAIKCVSIKPHTNFSHQHITQLNFLCLWILDYKLIAQPCCRFLETRHIGSQSKQGCCQSNKNHQNDCGKSLFHLCINVIINDSVD